MTFERVGLREDAVPCVADSDGATLPCESIEVTLPEPSPDAVALLMYTSGTTGVPKGVMLTQSNLAANACAISVEHELTAADRELAVLPLHHINAFAVTMLAPLAHAGSLTMPAKFFRRALLGAGDGLHLDQRRADDDFVPA